MAQYISPIFGLITDEQIKKFKRHRQGILAIEQSVVAPVTIKGANIYDSSISRGLTTEQASYVTTLFCSNSRMINDLIESGKTEEYVAYELDYNRRLKERGLILSTCSLKFALEEDIKIYPLKEYIPPPPECSVFGYLDSVQGKSEVYKTINQKEILPALIEDSAYDGALEKVHSRINRKVENFFGSNLNIEDSELSQGTTIDCPDSRTYEFEIYDDVTHDIQYALKYAKGTVIKKVGNLPVDGIVSILKEARVWEK